MITVFNRSQGVLLWYQGGVELKFRSLEGLYRAMIMMTMMVVMVMTVWLFWWWWWRWQWCLRWWWWCLWWWGWRWWQRRSAFVIWPLFSLSGCRENICSQTNRILHSHQCIAMMMVTFLRQIFLKIEELCRANNSCLRQSRWKRRREAFPHQNGWIFGKVLNNHDAY